MNDARACPSCDVSGCDRGFTGLHPCILSGSGGVPLCMFHQVPDLAWNGLIIRWLQVQILPGPPHTDQGKHPKTPVVATDSDRSEGSPYLAVVRVVSCHLVSVAAQMRHKNALGAGNRRGIATVGDAVDAGRSISP